MTCWKVGRFVHRIVSGMMPVENPMRSLVASACHAAGSGPCVASSDAAAASTARQSAARQVVRSPAPQYRVEKGRLHGPSEHRPEILVEISVPALAVARSHLARPRHRAESTVPGESQANRAPGSSPRRSTAVQAASRIAAPGSSTFPSSARSILLPPAASQASTARAALSARGVGAGPVARTARISGHVRTTPQILRGGGVHHRDDARQRVLLQLRDAGSE